MKELSKNFYFSTKEWYVTESFVLCATQLAGGTLLMLKYFEVTLNIVESYQNTES